MDRLSSQLWRTLPAHWRGIACHEPGSVLLESSLPSASEHHSYLFQHPHSFITANTPEEIPALFETIESHLAAGRWVAGWFSYEAGSHFLDLPGRSASGPLAMLAMYDAPELFDHRGPGEAQQTPTPLAIAPMPTTDRHAYTAAIHQIKQWIAAGETYQLNYTAQMQSPCSHTPLEVYEALIAQQPSSFAALVHFPNQPAILSFSPELFFRVDSNAVITTRPMKGTAPRGSTPHEDHLRAQALQQDEKNRAEHVMIVDLLRNDLNRICRTGTVRADDLFHVEQYQTLHQMTSRVSGSLPPDTPWYEVFHALFPGGSITGAPKRHTAKLIQQVEHTPRGVYTGAIGYFAPDRTACFNIAIRTAVLHHDTSAAERHPEQSGPNLTQQDRHPERNEVESKDLLARPSPIPQRETATLTFGVGGGIVADSTASSEYNEALLKAAFIQRAAQPYQLIETMRAVNGTVPFLQAHLQRLTASAKALGFACDTARIRNEIATLQATGRVRLQLHRNGHIDVAISDAHAWPPELHLVLSPQRIDPTHPHLRHKTTFRPEYGPALAAAQANGFHDTLFQNTQDELTESCIANLLVQIEGRWMTPPLTSGVLPGILRARLLHTNQIEEQIITLDHLNQATAAALCNALRGIAPITFLQLPNGERIHWAKPSTLPKP